MGGCYSGGYGNSSCSSSSQRAVARKPAQALWKRELKTFAKDHDASDLIKAYKHFFSRRKSGGFFAKVSEASGIARVEDIPKEFPDTEYEVKFDVVPFGGASEEPTVVRYLDAFDFPVGPGSRFLKDPVNNFAVGINHFIGDDSDERLVVIQKCGKTYLKEKGLVVPVKLGVPYEDVVIKRTEARYAADEKEIKKKVQKVKQEAGVEYRGRIRKEKGDAFLLDTSDGRLYSMSFTRAHLTRPGELGESAVQRQLEMEYAGYIPGFRGFEENSEVQIVRSMVDIAKYTSMMYSEAPLFNDWRMKIAVTSERKYDFVSGKEAKQISGQPATLSLPTGNLELVLSANSAN